MSHDAHAAPASFWNRIFSTDHKVIAKQYLFTGVAMAFLGGILAQIMRLQLANPGHPVPGLGVVQGIKYNATVTMHGTVMIFWVAMPMLLGAFGNLLIPLMVGTRDMAFPRLNMISYWTFFLSTVVLIASFLVPGGPSPVGWTAYPPLSSNPAYSSNVWGVHLWIIAVALELVAFLMGGINYITTAINLRAPGMRMKDLPLIVWMQIAASIIFLFSVGPLVAGAVMLLLDRTAGTGFYNAAAGGDPLLFQHLFWFFGHPEVYVLLLPGLGIVAEILPVFSRKPIFGYRWIVWSTIATGLLSFVVWAHHQFVSGMDPRLAAPFSLTTILISVPVAVTLFCFMATLFRGSIEFTTAMLFALGMMAVFLIGGVTGILNGSAAADIYIHDTYFVEAHFHYALIPPVFFSLFAGDLLLVPEDVWSDDERDAGTHPFPRHVRVRERDLPAHVRDGTARLSPPRLRSEPVRRARRHGGHAVDRDHRHGRTSPLPGTLADQLLRQHEAGPRGRGEPLARQHARMARPLATAAR